MNIELKHKWAALSAIFPVVFNAIVFIGGPSFTIAFWVSYICIHLAYIGLVLSIIDTLRVKNITVLGYPMIYLSWVYFAVTCSIGIVFMLFNDASLKMALIPQVIVSGMYFFIYILNMLANDNTEAAEARMHHDVQYIKTITAEVKRLMSQTKDEMLKKRLEKLYDAIRNSQVRSNPSLLSTEKVIMLKIEQLKEMMNSNNCVELNKLIESIEQLLVERNDKIALSQ